MRIHKLDMIITSMEFVYIFSRIRFGNLEVQGHRIVKIKYCFVVGLNVS